MNKADKKLFYTILLPSIIDAAFSQLFAVVDSVMVGQMPGSTVAVAALSITQSPINLIICVTNAFFIGTTAAIAWHVGTKEKEKVYETAHQSLMLATVIGLVLFGITYIFASEIMGFVCSNRDILPTAVEYYRINAIGFFFQIVSISITAAFRGIGKTKMPLIYNTIGNGANVVLNYILIYGKLGISPMYVKGAAVATVISKVIIFTAALSIFIFGKDGFKPRKEKFTLRLSDTMKHRMLKIGLTGAGEQLILQSGATITAKIISVLPTPKIASLQVVSNIESFAWSTGDACCTASTALFGKSLGEKDEKKGRAYLRLTEYWALIFAGAEILIMCLGGKFICRLFSNDTSLYPDIIRLLLIASLGLPCINTHKTVSGALRGAGDSFAPLIASLISLWVFRVALGYVLISVLGKGIYAYRWCLDADQFVRMVCMLIFYFTNHWKKIKINSRE